MAEINMRQIEVFLSAAKHQNISKAAAELYISQPALSKTISKIEKDFGSPLFSRTNRGVTLTDEGKELYSRLDFEFHRFRVSVESILNQKRRDPSDTLRIGSLNREVIYLVAQEQIQAYRLRHPEIRIELERYDAYSLRRKLLCEELDLIMTRDSELIPPEEFETLFMCEYPVFFLVPFSQSDSGVASLSGKTLFLESPVQRQWAENICADYGIVPADVRYAGSYSMLATLICRDDGFSIDSKMVLSEAEAASIAYLPVKRAFHGRVESAWRRGHISPLAEDFAAFLRPGDANGNAPNSFN